MSPNPSHGNPIAPLSIGNVVSAGVRLYSSNLRTYLQLALVAQLWILVPIYGWAKYAAIGGLISRLAFRELISQPESVETARSMTNPRLWSFLRVAFQVFFSLALIYIGLVIVGGILAGIVGGILGTILGNSVSPIVLLATLTIVLVALTWYYSRWIVAEVPLAVEENINGSESIARSWELTKTSVVRIQGIVLVAFAVTIPILLLFNYLPQIFLLNLKQGSTTYSIVYLISWLTSLVGGLFVMPFWQAIKAVLYYDLRSRREGLGLQLGGRNL